MTDGDTPCCWVCLGTEAPLCHPCKCPEDRVVHLRCLARWQLQSAGRSEEHCCRFCQAPYPDWKQTLTPSHLKPATPVVSVQYNGTCYRLRVKPGPRGLAAFQRQLQDITGMSALDCMQITFQCRAPGDSQELSFKGLSAFDAAIHCASISAAERLSRQPSSPPQGAVSDAGVAGSESDIDTPLASEEGMASGALPRIVDGEEGQDGAAGGAASMSPARARHQHRDRQRRRSVRGLQGGEGEGSAVANARAPHDEGTRGEDGERRRTAPATLLPHIAVPASAGAAAAEQRRRLSGGTAVGIGGLRLAGRREPSSSAPFGLPADSNGSNTAGADHELGMGCLDTSPALATAATRASLDSSVLLHGHTHHHYNPRHQAQRGGAGASGSPIPEVNAPPATGGILPEAKPGQLRLVSRLRTVMREMFGFRQ